MPRAWESANSQGRCGRAGRWFLRLGWLAAAGLVTLILGQGGGAEEQAAPSPRLSYDLVVLVVGQAGGQAQVALSYAGRLSHSRLRAGVAAIARETGARVTQLTIRDERTSRGSSALATSASFTLDRLVSGVRPLPVSSLAAGLPAWRRMRLVFVLEPGLPFRGPATVNGEDFAASLVAGPAGEEADLARVRVYEYDVVTMNRGRGEDPAQRGLTKRGPSAEAARRRHRGEIVLSAVLVLAAAGTARALVRRRRKKARTSIVPGEHLAGPGPGAEGRRNQDGT